MNKLLASDALPARWLRSLFAGRRRQWLTLTNLGGAQGILFLTGLTSSVLIARNVSLEIYGQYQVILSLIAIVSSLCLTGLSQSLTISAAKRYDGNLTKILWLKIVAGLVGSLVLVGASFFYRSTQPMLAFSLIFAAFLFPLSILHQIWLPWLTGRGDLNQLSLFRVISAIVGVSVLILLILFVPTIEVDHLVLGVFGVPTLVSLGVLIYALQGRTNTTVHQETINYGFHTTAATLLTGLVASDKLIINGYLSASDVAIYAIALVFPTQIKTTYAIFNQMITRHIYAADSVTAAWKYLKDKIGYLVVFFVFIGIVGFFAIPILIPLLFSERYVAAIPYGKWMWLSLALTAPITYLVNILRAQKKVTFIYTISIGQPVLLISLYFLLVGYGVWGIVIARIINYWATAVIYLGFFLYYLWRDPVVARPEIVESSDLS